MSKPLHITNDPVPNPEPAVPSLDRPDPEVFHRDPPKPPDPKKDSDEANR